MQQIAVFLALWMLAIPAFAQGTGHPATVLDHLVEVYLENNGRLRLTQTWVVRIEDPEGSSAGLPAPPGLDGATDGEARVLGDLLLVPPDVAAGDVLTLQSVIRDRAGPYSGVFTTAPDLPLAHAQVTVRSPRWLPVTVWSDGRAERSFERTRSSRTARFAWNDVDSDEPPQVVWTTWADWGTAGEALTEQVEPLLADKQELGRALAADIPGMSIAELVDRIGQRVEVFPEDYGEWESARATVETLETGRGTAADRGVALLSILRAAGHDARPALYSPVAATGTAPLSVPAPTQFARPAVAVFTAKRVVWIDPAANHTAVPDLPASMAGAVAWVPGRLPVQLAAYGSTDGLVSVNALLRFDPDGNATWSATITASGTAREWIRSLLAPLAEEGRHEALLALARQGRPDLERFTLTATGAEDPKRALKISVQGHDDAVLAEIGPGMEGSIAPLLAPGLAGWLPTRILIHEELAIDAPPGKSPITVIPGEPTYHPELVLTRTVRREADRLILVTEALRPDRTDSPARAAEASRFLAANATTGPQVLYLGTPSPTLAKAVRADARFGSEAERAVIEALLWLSVDDRVRARTTFKKALASIAVADLALEIRRHGTPGDARPYLVLYDASKKDTTVWIEAVEGIALAGDDREAWLRAAVLAQGEQYGIRLRAYRVMYLTQPETQPDASADPAGHAAWLPRPEILTLANETARGLSRGPVDGDPQLMLYQARHDLEHGRPADALPLLDELMKGGDDPVVMVLRAQARAQQGIAADDLVAEIEEAVRRAPFDAEVLGRAADAMMAVGRADKALRYGLSAARLAFTEPERWYDAAGFALAAGDLATAMTTARRASDLDPQWAEAARRLQLVATLVQDQDAADLGASRAGETRTVKVPATVDAMLELVPPDALLALLQHHEEAVVADARLLGLRARLRLDADLLDEAARDGVVLGVRHGDARGWALAFAGTAGRLWSSAALDPLEPYVAHPDVRAARMEYALLSTDGDPLGDARAMPDDPSARIVVRLKSDAAGIAAETGWPSGIADPVAGRPVGYDPNPLLGAVDGVTAWSHPDLATSVLLAASPDAGLPPPLSALYTPREPDQSSLAGGGRLVRLDGGSIPTYAAVAPHGDHVAIGVGFTASAAIRALDTALDTWPLE